MVIFLPFCRGFADFGAWFLGGHFVGVVGDLSFGLFGCGPKFLDCVGLDVPLFCYTVPLPDIDRGHDVYSTECNIVIDLQTNLLYQGPWLVANRRCASNQQSGQDGPLDAILELYQSLP